MASGGGNDQFTKMAAAVARELLGDENKKLSSAKELRFGNKGSISVDLEKGTWFEHGTDLGGGVLSLIERETGRKGKECIEWLREHGFAVEDRGGQNTRPKDRDSNRNFGPDDRDDPPPRDDGPPFKTVKTWPYYDEAGTLLFEVVRMENGEIGSDGKPVKTYRQRKPDASKPGGWDWSTKGVRQVPYRLVEIQEAVANNWTVFIVEGEKAADRLIEEGIPATTNARGALKWEEGLNEFFKGARVVILADDDPQATNKKTGEPLYHDDGRPKFVGWDHANDVARQLHKIAADVRVVQLTDRKKKEDVYDWIEQGGQIEDLYDIAAKAPKWAAEPFRSRFNAITWGALEDPGPQHEWTVKGVLTRGETSVCAGASKAGKSFLIIDIGMAVARGLPWMGKKTRQGLVVYQAGEGAKGLKKRLKAYRIRHGLSLKDPIPFVLLPAQLNLFRDDDPTNAFIAEVKYWSDYHGQPCEMIVIDTFAKAMTGANENDGRDVGMVLERCARIAQETGAHVCLVHHMNAEGHKLRGHTSVVANLDNVLIVSKTDGMHDADNRPIREVIVDKQKDGEDREKFRFVLGQVIIGKDEDDDNITSCVVLNPNGDASDEPVPERASITDGEATFLRAVEKAVTDHGTKPPAATGLPQSLRVVEWKRARDAYDSIAFDTDEVENEDADARAKRLAARRKQMERVGEKLLRKGIIGRENPWIWLTGKKIKGYSRSGQQSSEGHSQSHEHPADNSPVASYDDTGFPAMWGDD